MIDVRENYIVEDAFKFIGYFEAKGCIPNMSSMGTRNVLSSGHYYVTQYAEKHKARAYMHRRGQKVLHFNHDEKTIVERLGYSSKEACGKTTEELWEKELEYEDVRLFSALDVGNYSDKMTVKISPRCKPAVTISEARSVDPVEIYEMKTTRSYDVMQNKEGKNSGSKYDNPNWGIEYGVFRFTGGVDPDLAKKFRLTEQDLDDFFEALWHMFDYDASTLRPAGSMQMLKLVIYKTTPEFLENPTGMSLNGVFNQRMIYRKNKNGFVASIDDYVIERHQEYPKFISVERDFRDYI